MEVNVRILSESSYQYLGHTTQIHGWLVVTLLFSPSLSSLLLSFPPLLVQVEYPLRHLQEELPDVDS